MVMKKSQMTVGIQFLWLKQDNIKKTGGLAKLLQWNIEAKVMLTINIDIQDYLINKQLGNLLILTLY